jgi:inner membrane protein
MDNLTHSLVGLTLARCGFDREQGSVAMLVLAANIPDIDAYNFFTDSLSYLEVHRGYTHALVFVPLVALLPIAIVCAIRGKRLARGPFLWMWFGSTLAVLSHVLMDWTNPYGVRMLLPFSGRWLRLDITNIVDPIIWLILIATLAASSLAALVSSEIGGRKYTGPARAWAFLALLTVAGYEAYRWTSHERALLAMTVRLYNDEPPKHVYAFPAGGSLRWRGLVEGEKFYFEVPVEFSGAFDMRDGEFDYKPGHAPALDAARATRTFRIFEKFNQVPLYRLYPLVDAMRVELIDLRFGSIKTPGFKAMALVEPDGRIADVGFGFGQ